MMAIMIETLKQRVDPGDIYSLQWRPLDSHRFEVLMTLADAETHKLDPSKLSRLIQQAGVLEFRMAPWIQGYAHASEYQIGNAEAKEYLAKLQREGPQPGHKRGDPWQWFPVRDKNEKLSGVVVGDYAGRRFLLLSNNPSDVMLDPPGNSQWLLIYARPGTDQLGKPCINFYFESRGAAIFSRLTNAHKANKGTGRPGDLMAVLLDDEVYSAPSIQSTISDSGQITGNFTQQEVYNLVNIMEAGTLPVRANPEPVSVREIPQSAVRDSAAKLTGLYAALAAATLCFVLAMIRACRGRAMHYGLWVLGAAAATAGAWAILAGAPFCGPVPVRSLWVNAFFVIVLFAAAMIGRAGFASKKLQSQDGN